MTPRVADHPSDVSASMEQRSSSGESLRVWGLTVPELHDAYWAGQGVQCVRRGEGLPPSRSVDIYLLMDPGQMALFDLREFAEDVQWTRAELCRVRVIEAGEETYHERVVLGEDGLVKRIARVYGREVRQAHRVLLTERRDLAEAWHAAKNRRDAWLALRRSLATSRAADFRAHGTVFQGGVRSDEEAILTALVSRWSDPPRSVEGIAELAPGVFGLEGTVVPADRRLVGPLWIGAAPVDADVVVGPRCLVDRGACSVAAIRSIVEILSPEGRRRARASAPPEPALYHTVKRGIDILVASLVLLAISPIVLVVSAAVVLDDGFPIFFGHRRQTKGGRVFRCWKFRTMRRNAEALAKELRALNVCDGPQFFIQNDPRVTRVGKFLRQWHLDELPQFWNVLVGDMSMVGPRPSPDGENQYCPAWRELRLSVRPGITGLWQVERTREPGRDFQEWIKFDIEYVQRASLGLDFAICVKTIANILGWKSHGPNDKS